MKVFLINAFSANMLAERPYQSTGVVFAPVASPSAAVMFLPADTEYVSAVGHADTAGLFSEPCRKLFPEGVPVNRVSLALEPGDTALLGQYVGPRLPEGSKTLPEGAEIRWFWIEIQNPRAMAREREEAEDAARTALRAAESEIATLKESIRVASLTPEARADEESRARFAAHCDANGPRNVHEDSHESSPDGQGWR